MDINKLSQWWLLLVWALAVFLAYKYFSKKMNWQKSKSCIYHQFFSELDFYISNKIPNLRLTNKSWEFDKARTEIFKDLLLIKFRIWKKWINEFINDKSDDILESSTKAINDLVNEYNKERIDKWIPSIVIDKFNFRHEGHAQSLMDWIRSICGGGAFNTIEEMKNAILYLHLMMLWITFIDAKNTLWVLNWELKGINYKSLTII